MSNQMKEIDWSNAPEGATHWHDEYDCYVACWVKEQDGQRYYLRADGSGCTWMKDCNPLPIDKCTPRPAAQPAWSGEGLPPVGTVCEAWHNGCAQGVVQVRYSGGCMVLWNVKLKHEQCSASENYTFKPLRTPEQIAAEEREKAITQMAEIMSGADDDLDCARRLYDANFRKVGP